MRVALLLTVTPLAGGPELFKKSALPNTAPSHKYAATSPGGGGLVLRGWVGVVA